MAKHDKKRLPDKRESNSVLQYLRIVVCDYRLSEALLTNQSEQRCFFRPAKFEINTVACKVRERKRERERESSARKKVSPNAGKNRWLKNADTVW